MTLDQFMAVTEERLPTAGELMALCAEVGIGFGRDAAGRPAMKASGEAKAVALVLAGLLKREPWRSQVVKAKVGELHEQWRAADDRPVECLWPGNGLIGRHWFPEQGWPVGAYFWRFVGDQTWQPIPGKTWPPPATAAPPAPSPSSSRFRPAFVRDGK